MTQQSAPTIVKLLRVSDVGKGLKMASNQLVVTLSSDSGNGLSFGSDGGVFTAGGSGGSGSATPNYNQSITSSSTQVIS